MTYMAPMEDLSGQMYKDTVEMAAHDPLDEEFKGIKDKVVFSKFNGGIHQGWQQGVQRMS